MIQRTVLNELTTQLNNMLSEPNVGAATHRGGQAIGQQAFARDRLSKRQMEVFQLLGQGKSNKEIAATLLRSPNTIKLHVSAILRRLKLRSRTQAALLASGLHDTVEPNDITLSDIPAGKPSRR